MAHPFRDRAGELAAARAMVSELRSHDARRTWSTGERKQLVDRGLLTYQEAAEDL